MLRHWLTSLLVLLPLTAAASYAQDHETLPIADEPVGNAWQMHVIDNSSQGADGVKLADFNNDGKLDIVTGWEEGGLVRIYLNPGKAHVKKAWPRIDVGKAADVEDAVFSDLDSDGDLDVIASTEGKTKQVYFFYNQSDKDATKDNKGYQFKRVTVPQLAKKSRWMFAWPRDMDGQHGLDLVIGSKDPDGVVLWMQSPEDPGNIKAWKPHWLTDATWIMSIWFEDINHDQREDIVLTDRRGKTSGVIWLQRPQTAPTDHWPAHRIWTTEHDIMSMCITDLDADGLNDMVVAVKNYRVIWLRRLSKESADYEAIEIHLPKTTGNTRAVMAGDLDRDGDLDLGVTTWNSKDLHGVIWLENDGTPLDGGWKLRTLSDKEKGIKYDRIELIDLDEDGDLDLLTCEEHEANGGLGVIWYENPN